MKDILSVMKEVVAKNLESMTLDLIGVENGTSKKENGEEVTFTRLELEVPRGNGGYSRCRFSCKVPQTLCSFADGELDAGIPVSLNGLTISYISGSNVYFKAESFDRVMDL